MYIISFLDWTENRQTFYYTRTLSKNGKTVTWKHQKQICKLGVKPSDTVHEWNRLSKLQFKQYPENGLWHYELED